VTFSVTKVRVIGLSPWLPIKKCRGRVVGATSSEGFLAGKDNNAIWCNEMT